MNNGILEISVIPEDIEQCGPGVIGNPIARALGRTTGTRWRVCNGQVAQEMNAPYRVVALPANVQEVWESYIDFSKLPPFTFQIDWEDEKFAA